jgi:hypothetical protein
MPVLTRSPCQFTSRGSPTLTDKIFIFCRIDGDYAVFIAFLTSRWRC